MKNTIRVLLSVLIVSVLTLTMLASCDFLSPCAKGHDFDGQPYLNDGTQHWQQCKNCDAISEKFNHTPTSDDGDCTTAVKCEVCDAVTAEGAAAHDYEGQEWALAEGQHERKCANCDHIDSHKPEANVDGNCATEDLCKHCSLVVVKAGDHNYEGSAWSLNSDGKHERACVSCDCKDSHTPEAAEDDGDCTTAVSCKHCDTVMTEANTAHTYGAWSLADGKHARKCDNCVKTERHDPDANADNDCTTADACKHCNLVVTEANTAHTYGAWSLADGKHTRKCENCAKSDSHSPEVNADNDCTTADACKHCNLVVTEANTAHTYGAWSLTDGKHTRKCDNCVKTESHDPDANADNDCTTADACKHCNLVVAEATAHTYTGAPVWTSKSGEYTATYACDHAGCTAAPKAVTIKVTTTTGVAGIVHTENASEFKFSINASEGYRVVSVKVGRTTLTADNGVYSTAIADSEVVVEMSNMYTVTWQDKNGNTIATETLAYGATPSRDAIAAYRNGNHWYEFVQWTPAITAVTEDVTYKAQMSIWASWYGESASAIGAISGPSKSQTGLGGSGTGATVITTDANAFRHDYQKSVYYRLALQSGDKEFFDLTGYENISFYIATPSDWGRGATLTDKNGTVILTFVEKQIYNIIVTNAGLVYVDNVLAEGVSMADGVEFYIDRTNVRTNASGANYMSLEYTFPTTNVEFTPVRKVDISLNLSSTVDSTKIGFTSASADADAATLGAKTVYTMSWSAWAYGIVDAVEDISAYNEIIFYVKTGTKCYFEVGGSKFEPYATSWTQVRLVKSESGWNVYYGNVSKGNIASLAELKVNPNGAQSSGDTFSFTNLVGITDKVQTQIAGSGFLTSVDSDANWVVTDATASYADELAERGYSSIYKVENTAASGYPKLTASINIANYSDVSLMFYVPGPVNETFSCAIYTRITPAGGSAVRTKIFSATSNPGWHTLRLEKQDDNTFNVIIDGTIVNTGLTSLTELQLDFNNKASTTTYFTNLVVTDTLK